MSLPSGVTEEQFLAAVNHIAGVLAAKHRFGTHDNDDIAQMVAVYALEALPRYEPAKGNLEGFIYSHCANRLSNARRNELGCRTDTPCQTCYQHAIGKGAGHADGSTCPKFVSWWARRQARANLAIPCGLDRVVRLEQQGAMWAGSTVESDTANKELLDLIDAHIPLDLRADYLRMRAGESVVKVRRERVLQAARDILDDPRQYDNQTPSTAFEESEDVFDDSDDGNE